METLEESVLQARRIQKPPGLSWSEPAEFLSHAASKGRVYEFKSNFRSFRRLATSVACRVGSRVPDPDDAERHLGPRQAVLPRASRPLPALLRRFVPRVAASGRPSIPASPDSTGASVSAARWRPHGSCGRRASLIPTRTGIPPIRGKTVLSLSLTAARFARRAYLRLPAFGRLRPPFRFRPGDPQAFDSALPPSEPAALRLPARMGWPAPVPRPPSARRRRSRSFLRNRAPLAVLNNQVAAVAFTD